MQGVPLPLSLADIDTYVACRPILIDRSELDAAVFALDDYERKRWAEESDRKNKKSGNE